MNRKSETFSPNLARRGLTLVEVLAALVILGTLLTGIVVAKSRHMRQIAQTRERLAAVRLADQLISRWWSTPDEMPINQRGATEDPAWVWETRLESNPAVEAMGGRVLRVMVRPAEAGMLSGPEEREIVVDLVLPGPEKPSRAQSESPITPRQERKETP